MLIAPQKRIQIVLILVTISLYMCAVLSIFILSCLLTLFYKIKLTKKNKAVLVSSADDLFGRSQ